MPKLRVLDAQYRVAAGKPVITLMCRDDKNRRMVRVEGFEPYFYVPIDTPIPNHPAIVRVEDCSRLTIDGGRVKRVVVRVPMDVRSVRTYFDETFEADVVFGLRFCIDKGIREGIEVGELKDVYHESEVKGY